MNTNKPEMTVGELVDQLLAKFKREDKFVLYIEDPTDIGMPSMMDIEICDMGFNEKVVIPYSVNE